ncbi:MAG: GIY-YIG nuclease family protein [Patescibacteria group bacterium]
MNLSFQAKKAPQTPGVYIFKDKKGGILYIGRAINLRRRIVQYFQKPVDFRIQEMVDLARTIKLKKTKGVLEAIILEANLIKKYWPKYNIKDKDDRSFIYIFIPEAEYPRPYIIRGKEIENQSASWWIKTEKFNLFGPYQSLSLVKSALKIIRRIFPYSACKPFQGKPCFDYQIGLCPGLCIGAISKKDYQKNIKNLILFLKGERKKLIEKLKKENPEKIKALEHIQDVALISADQRLMTNDLRPLNRIEGYDISHLSGKEIYGSMIVFINGEPDKTQYRLFKIKNAKAGDDLAALKEMIIRRFKHKEWQFPNLILIDGGRPQVSHIEKTLKELSINISLVGISKYAKDELIFVKNIKKSTKVMSMASKNILLKIRDEAHRFALKSSRRKRLKIV